MGQFRPSVHVSPYSARTKPAKQLPFLVRRSFRELTDRALKNSKLQGQRLDVAHQEVSFRLDRAGAELRSEARLYGKCDSGPCAPCIFDRPFLIVMKKRRAAAPLFVMWVDNAKLLNPWRRSPRPRLVSLSADSDQRGGTFRCFLSGTAVHAK